MTNPLEETMRRELRRFLVQKYMFCTITGDILDMDKSVFILDEDGDPCGVFSQAGWQKIVEQAESLGIPRDKILGEGKTLDETSVRPSS